MLAQRWAAQRNLEGRSKRYDGKMELVAYMLISGVAFATIVFWYPSHRFSKATLELGLTRYKKVAAKEDGYWSKGVIDGVDCELRWLQDRQSNSTPSHLRRSRPKWTEIEVQLPAQSASTDACRVGAAAIREANPGRYTAGCRRRANDDGQHAFD